MNCDPQRANAVTAGLWLIGLGILFATKFWWPGILFLVGITAIVQGAVQGRGWQAIHGGLWITLIAVWAMFRFNMAFFFVALGLYVIISAFLKPSPFSKPYVDNRLD